VNKNKQTILSVSGIYSITGSFHFDAQVILELQTYYFLILFTNLPIIFWNWYFQQQKCSTIWSCPAILKAAGVRYYSGCDRYRTLCCRKSEMPICR